MAGLNKKIYAISFSGVLLASVGIGLYKTKPETPQKLIGQIQTFPNISKGVTIPGENITFPLQIICADEKLKTDKDPYIMEIASFTDERGAPIFNCEDAYSLQMQGIEAEYIQNLILLRNGAGDSIFTAKDIIHFKDADGTVEYARQFMGSSFSGKQLPQLYRLGLNLEDLVQFRDTVKPNALLVYPTEDERTTFRDDNSVTFFNWLRGGYDIRVAVASTEDEVYDALDASKGFEFAMFSGHGTETTLSLGTSLGKKGGLDQENESYFIDTSDYELAGHLKYLHRRAVIFLNSCSTAKKVDGGNNLAEAVAYWGRGRTVIAATEDLHTNRLSNHILYPFEVTLMDESNKRDITYRYLSNSHQ